MIESGNVRRYILYAIGEIVLVVIGILIALQINNWNEWRKDRIQEKIVLQDLKKNLEINKRTLEADIEFLHHINRSSEVILNALDNKLTYNDSLRNHFHQARVTKQDLFLSNIGYQELRDKGIDLISNKDLAEEILNLFEATIPRILSTNSLVNSDYLPFINHLVQNFSLVEGQGLTPNNYESLFSDHFYISWIRAYKEGRRYLIATDHQLIKELESVLQLIKNELDAQSG